MLKFKRFLVVAIAPSILAMGLAGCSDTTKVKSETTTSTPNGSQTETVTKEVKKTGDAKTTEEHKVTGPTTNP